MLTKENFSKEVDDFIVDNNADVMSAIIEIAVAKKIELEGISKFLTANIKSRLEAEALDLNLIKKRKRLPL